MRIIRGKYGRRRFTVPTNITARPTTDFARENIFNVLENLVDFEEEAPRALDLFAGTGAVSFELLSRGCSSVTSVEKAPVQAAFIRKVAQELHAENEHHLVKGDVFRFLSSARGSYGLIFADPPYDLPEFDQVPEKVLASGLLAPGGIFILEHSVKRDYSSHPWFSERRAYGSVNFSLFRRPAPASADESPEVTTDQEA